MSNIRHSLHAHPELSGNEHDTHDFIVKYLSVLNPDSLFQHIGGYGVIAVFNGREKGCNVAFRSDIDALPIQENNDIPYKSTVSNVSHKCGHDGHTAILLSLAEKISHNRPQKGNIILVFQPEEETGYGAQKIVDSGVLDELNTNVIFGIHNLPNFPEKSIVIKYGTFAAASCGLAVNLTGRQTHAAHPENGINPGLAVAEMINFLSSINNGDLSPEKFQQGTLIYTRIGEVAFGTSAGDAQIMTTLRAFSNSKMQNLVDNVINTFKEISSRHHLDFDYHFQDNFAAVENNTVFVDKIKETAQNGNFNIVEIEEPFRWSEDFSNYLKHYPGAFFGIGDGLNHPELHSPIYDFPDSIIDTASDFEIALFKTLNDN